MNLLVKYSTVDTKESKLQLNFKFERKTKRAIEPLDLRKIWIYKDGRLILEMEKFESFDLVQSTWDFPSIPKGFKITFPENLDTIPLLGKKDHVKFDFIAGGSYGQWEHKPNT